ncbi:hypothetical protein K413DRAFT_5030 [Clostridium sp. ASBs410]|nr:hypothetical protein K413DRAFT_5030 [Clostridium sp. ASBs410]
MKRSVKTYRPKHAAATNYSSQSFWLSLIKCTVTAVAVAVIFNSESDLDQKEEEEQQTGSDGDEESEIPEENGNQEESKIPDENQIPDETKVPEENEGNPDVAAAMEAAYTGFYDHISDIAELLDISDNYTLIEGDDNFCEALAVYAIKHDQTIRFR